MSHPLEEAASASDSTTTNNHNVDDEDLNQILVHNNNSNSSSNRMLSESDDPLHSSMLMVDGATFAAAPAPRGRSVSAASDLIHDPHRSLFRQQKSLSAAAKTKSENGSDDLAPKNLYAEQIESYREQIESFVTKKVAITLTPTQKKWTYYKCVSRAVTTDDQNISNSSHHLTHTGGGDSAVTSEPLIILPDICSKRSIDTFYQQVLSLVPRGYHVILVDLAPCYTHDEFVMAFHELIDYHIMSSLNGKFHLMGAGLSGHLAQCYAEKHATYISSLILCNSFVDNAWFADTSFLSDLYQLAPNFLLKMQMEGLFAGLVTEGEKRLVLSNEFMFDAASELNREQNASRLRLLYSPKKIDRSLFATQIPDSRITVIQTMDPGSLYPVSIRNELHSVYPHARFALMKDGGTFPYLCRAEDFNLYLIVHMRNVAGQNLPVYEHESNDTGTASVANGINERVEEREIDSGYNSPYFQVQSESIDEPRHKSAILDDSLILIDERNDDEYDVHETDMVKQQDPSHKLSSATSQEGISAKESEEQDEEPLF